MRAPASSRGAGRRGSLRRLPILAGAVLAAGLAAAPTLAADGCPDALITANIKTRLLADRGLAAFKINVDTDACVVTLNGCVHTPAQARRAKAIAMKVRKVRAVVNKLTICPADDKNEGGRKED
jgi:hyperosmotically inducible protein